MTMMRKRVRLAAVPLFGMALLGMSAPALAKEWFSLYGGSEYFSHREYDSGARLLTESGPRYFIGITAAQDVSPQSIVTLDMRLYTANVTYNGETIGPPVLPVKTYTGYRGSSSELSLIHYVGAGDDAPQFGLLVALGIDWWQRQIKDSNSGTTPISGYTEKYLIGYSRLGAVFRTGEAWRFEGGIKYPLYADEQVAIYDSVHLSPARRVSGFFSAHYRLNMRWSLTGYYDSYRFDKSPSVPVTQNGAPTIYVQYQPKFEQYRYGISLSHQF